MFHLGSMSCKTFGTQRYWIELFTLFLRTFLHRNHIYKWCMPFINVYLWQCFDPVGEIWIGILLSLRPGCFPAQKWYAANIIKHSIHFFSCPFVVLEEGSKGASLWPSSNLLQKIGFTPLLNPVLHYQHMLQQNHSSGYSISLLVCCSWIMLINNWFCIRIKLDFPPGLSLENHIPLLEVCARMWDCVPQHCCVPS